jgi:hypothetical protein
MLARPNPLQLPRQRLSPTGLAASGVLHIALVWLLLQVAPVQQAVRYVVVQAVRPFNAPAPPPAAPVSRAITPPAALGSAGEPPAVFTQRPESSVPIQATDTLPDTLQQPRRKPRRERRQLPAP